MIDTEQHHLYENQKRTYNIVNKQTVMSQIQAYNLVLTLYRHITEKEGNGIEFIKDGNTTLVDKFENSKWCIIHSILNDRVNELYAKRFRKV